MQIGRRTQLQRDDSWRELSDGGGDPGSAVPGLYHEHDPASEGGSGALIERADFFIRLATSHGHRRQGSMLVRRMYSWRGYDLGTSSGEPVRGNEVSLQACGPQGVFGTLSLRLDSPDRLLADELYRPEIDGYRERGRVVCEMTGFAVDRDYGSREVLACLFHLLYLYAHRRHGCSDLFIEVNPRHVGFYAQRLRFRVAGPQRTCMRVAAPAVLLHLDLGYVEALLRRAAHDPSAASRSLYAFFFPPHEEEGIVRRIPGGAFEARVPAAAADETPLDAMRARPISGRAAGAAL
jgi:hypothetical protein